MQLRLKYIPVFRKRLSRRQTAIFFWFCAGIRRDPRFKRGWLSTKTGTVAVVAVGMWKPAFGAGFQAPWDERQLCVKIPP